MGVERRIVELIEREGPIPFARFVDAALYHPDAGFFATRDAAGRSGGDFITSPETGSLFGALVARALDGWWDDLGRPDPFLVVEAGAGRGALCREILRSGPRCRTALRYVMVERSERLRHRQREWLPVEPFSGLWGPAQRVAGSDEPELLTGAGPIVSSLESLPAVVAEGVVLANELLDNLPFDVVQRDGSGWLEVRVGLVGAGLAEVLLPAPDDLVAWLGPLDAPDGARLPAQRAVETWIAAAAAIVKRGVVAVVDYTATIPELVERGFEGWLRTFREHRRGGAPLDALGLQDITVDVCEEMLTRSLHRSGLTPILDTTQAQWLRSLGLDDLLDRARRVWAERAHLGDIEALAARSRVGEGRALVDPGGLGAHRVHVAATRVTGPPKGVPPRR